MQSQRVVIIQRILPHYRTSFFVRLREALIERGIELILVYGQENPGTVPRTVDLPVSWAHKVENVYLHAGGSELVWQQCIRHARDADLVILEQANRLLANYVFLAARLLQRRRRTRIAYWGHGQNFQARRSNRVRGALKRQLITSVDWWFAYTEASADVVRSSGFPSERITVVNNAIDPRPMIDGMAALSDASIQQLRRRLGIEDAAKVALYCGGLHPGKELGFLLAAAMRIRAEVPEFHLVVVGDGPEAPRVMEAAAAHAWIHPVGPIFGADLATFYAVADLVMIPAHVGLVIVDCFIAQRPIFTTSATNHSPEIAYLSNEKNGVMSSYSVDDYASTVARYLRDAAKLVALRAGCESSAKAYTFDAMIDRFARGIVRCVERPVPAGLTEPDSTGS